MDTNLSSVMTPQEQSEFRRQCRADSLGTIDGMETFRRQWRDLVQKARAASNAHMWVQGGGIEQEHITKIYAIIEELAADIDSMGKANTLKSSVLIKHMSGLKTAIHSLTESPTRTPVPESSIANLTLLDSMTALDAISGVEIKELQKIMKESVPILIMQIERLNISTPPVNLNIKEEVRTIAAAMKNKLQSKEASAMILFAEGVDGVISIIKQGQNEKMRDGKLMSSNEFTAEFRSSFKQYQRIFLLEWERRMIASGKEFIIASLRTRLTIRGMVVINHAEMEEVAVELVSNVANTLDWKMLGLIGGIVKKAVGDREKEMEKAGTQASST